MADDIDDSSTGADLLPPPPEGKRSHRLRWATLSVVGVALVIAGLVAWRQVEPVLRARKYAKVTYSVPTAPRLAARTGETVYRIDPTRSSLTYRVQETIAGRSASTATGVTNGLAGDIAVDPAHLERARVGTIVANVEQFHSDNNLRDARLRQDFLESHHFPLARFTVSSVQGLKGRLVEGRTYRFKLVGTATVKGETVPVTFTATARADGGGLTATATTTSKLSSFDAGPISIAGLVRTKDDVRLTLKLRLLDPSQHTIPTKITGPDAKEPSGDAGVSFAKTVQPILEENCSSCHAPGKMAAGHLRIGTAGEARAISDGIKTVTQTRYMPPWPASDKGVPLKHKMSLTAAEIADLAAWAEGGGQLDVPASTKLPAPPPAAGVVPRADKTMKIEPYLGSAENPNDYRCFVLDPKVTSPRYLTGYTFLGDQIQELHHVQVFHISAEQRESARKLDGKDGQPGWSCYAGPHLRGQSPPDVPGRVGHRDAGYAGQSDLVAGWVPGQAPAVYPQNSGIYLAEGDALVMQIHYHFDHEAVVDESGLAIQLDPVTPDTKVLRVVNPLGPVEIPCAPADADAPLCDRDAAIADNVRLYGPSGAGNEEGLLGLCDKTPTELTKDFDGKVASSSCDLVVPEDGTVVAVLGHMHTIGRSIRLTLDPGTEKEKILLDIPRWSFDWQMNYALAEPMRVKAGQPIRLDCSWDRGADPNRPPKYIVFAEGTEDEMCFATYALIPDDQ